MNIEELNSLEIQSHVNAPLFQVPELDFCPFFSLENHPPKQTLSVLCTTIKLLKKYIYCEEKTHGMTL